jgi:hypothetical protein
MRREGKGIKVEGNTVRYECYLLADIYFYVFMIDAVAFSVVQLSG